jgi:hypothetical protein
MKRRMQVFAIALMLTIVSSSAGYARYFDAIPENAVWDEVSMDSDIFPAGTIISFLPNGARAVIVERTQYFISGGNWFLPIVNTDGVKYQVVFAPL